MQLFLRNLQQEQASQYEDQIKRAQRDASRLKEELNKTLEERDALKEKIAQVSSGLQSASNLRRQLDDKDKNITRLNQVITEQHAEFAKLQQNHQKLTDQINKHKDGTVELPLIKNLIVQYVNLANQEPAKKEPVLRLIANVLRLEESELDNVLAVAGCKSKGWLGFLRPKPGLPTQNSISIGASLRGFLKT